MALTTSVIPHVSGNYAKNDYASVRKSLNQSVSIVLAISTPLSIGMFLLASPVHAMFYKYDAYGNRIELTEEDAHRQNRKGKAISGLQRAEHVCFFFHQGRADDDGTDSPLFHSATT